LGVASQFMLLLVILILIVFSEV